MGFNGARLRIARLFHGLTQRELADRIAVSNGLIAVYENNGQEPKDEILEALCTVLEVEQAYFAAPVDEFQDGNFRRRISATERLKRQVLARGSLFGMVVRHLSQFGKLPTLNFPSWTPESLDDIDAIADRCRQHWKLPLDAPIGDMARVVENAGAVILSIDLQTAEKVDAFSRFGEVSVVVLNTQKRSPSRTLFDMAHEIGHGVMHPAERGIPLETREEEADRFAGAFLLPREAFAADFTANRSTGWSGLLDMKRHWRASIAAILVRAKQLRLIDAADSRTRFRQMNAWGWRKQEPEEPTVDVPTLFLKALDRAKQDYGKTPADIARELSWTPELFEAVTGIPAPRPNAPTVLSLVGRQRLSA